MMLGADRSMIGYEYQATTTIVKLIVSVYPSLFIIITHL